MNDSPRWCETCKSVGDHHTDRHDEMIAGESTLAVWNPKRGRVHRIMSNWRSRYWSEQTRCGMPTRNMTERGHADLSPENRCLTCWRRTDAYDLELREELTLDADERGGR